eukprot:CAMPEP_0178420620 /NCGR_PEP_ID=MMETSP0689_2-20121128/26227_1 /TAXON_ID=160604 /ORGANISM="Amphidinium massartii, Strain CS-259" /LENGTH=1043 /DNA_ID=CAMNT_0020042109 /DNA_START=1 /DNA_END=3132 /DNA_ORIENTATION=+
MLPRMGHMDFAHAGGSCHILFYLLALGSLLTARGSSHPTSSLLAQARGCVDSGYFLDFYTDYPDESLRCVARCPAGSDEVFQTCAGRKIPGQDQEIAVTIHALCGTECYWDSGMELSARLWMGIARLFKLPLAETSASIMLADTYMRQWFQLEHFVMWRPGYDDGRMPAPDPGVYGANTGQYDLFLAVRVHSRRLHFVNADLQRMLMGSAEDLAAKVHNPLGIRIFQIARRSVDAWEVVDAEDSVPRFKFKGLGWNQSPLYSEATGTARATTTYSYAASTTARPSTAGPAPAPAPVTARRCSGDCTYTMVGDGLCQPDCYTSSCWYDMGDCTSNTEPPTTVPTTSSSTLPTCLCDPQQLGDGRCDRPCFTEVCGYDGGDCDEAVSAGRRRATTTFSMPRTCGCADFWLGDGVCDSFCNTEQCNYDNGDCDMTTATASSSSTSSRSPSSTSSSGSSRRTQSASTTSSSASGTTSASTQPGLRGSSHGEQEQEQPVTNVNIIVERHEDDNPVTYRVLASDNKDRWYVDESPDDSESAANPLQSAVFIVAFFAVLGLMTLLGVCLVAKGIAPGAERRRRKQAMQAGQEDPEDDWMAPKRPCQNKHPTPAAAWSSAGAGQEHLRDSMHWRTKPSYARAAAVAMKAARLKERLAAAQALKKEHQSGRSKSMPAEARSTSKNSVFSGNSTDSTESTAAGSHWSPNSSMHSSTMKHTDTQHSFCQRSWSSSTLREAARSREPKVHPEPSSEDKKPPPSPAPVWKEPEKPPAPPPPPMPFSPQAQSGARSSHLSSQGFHRSDHMRATKSEPSQTNWRANSMEPPLRTSHSSADADAHRKSAGAASNSAQASRAHKDQRAHPRANPPPAQPSQQENAARTHSGNQNAKAEASRRGLFSSFLGRGGEAQETASTPQEKSKRSASSAGKAAPQPGPSVAPSSGRASTKPAAATAPPSRAAPKRSQTVPPPNKASKWWGASAKSSAQDPEVQSRSLISDMEKQLERNKNESLETRKRIFKDLQRQLHPDKNMDQPESAKLAFQKLMEQRATFLAG